jgi:hypothetical protein
VTDGDCDRSDCAHSYDGCTLVVTYDDATYDEVTGSYQIQSVTANNPTGTNGYPPRLITVWADYKVSI